MGLSRAPIAAAAALLAACGAPPPGYVPPVWTPPPPAQLYPLQVPPGMSGGAQQPGAPGNATWTGRQEFVQTVSGGQAVRCEYRHIGGQVFTVLLPRSSCPSSIAAR